MRSTDVDAVVELVRALLAEFGLRFGEGAETDHELALLPNSYEGADDAFWVSVDDAGALLGTCGVYPVSSGTFELRKMYLDRSARQQGLGQRLLDEVIAWCRAHGGKRMVLDTTHKMERAIVFFESNGFIRDDTQIRGARCSRGYTRDTSIVPQFAFQTREFSRYTTTQIPTGHEFTVVQIEMPTSSCRPSTARRDSYRTWPSRTSRKSVVASKPEAMHRP